MGNYSKVDINYQLAELNNNTNLEIDIPIPVNDILM